MNTGVKCGYVGDGRIRVRSLVNPQFFQIKGKANRMEIEFFNPDRISLEASIHLSLNPPAQRLVDQISEDKDSYQDNAENTTAPNNRSPHHMTLVNSKKADSEGWLYRYEAPCL